MNKSSITNKLLLLASAFCCFFIANTAFADDDDNRNRTITVNCNKSNASVQKAVDKVKRGKGATVFVVGTCSETVTIDKDDIVLSGNKAGNECDKSNPGGSGTINGTVIIDGVRARIEHMTLTGSDDGVGIINRATAQLNCNDISNNEGTGVYVLRSSNAVLRDNTLNGNGTRGSSPSVFFDCGLFAADASSVDSRGNTYTNNRYCAIEIDRQASFRNGAFLPRESGNPANPDERDVIAEAGCNPTAVVADPNCLTTDQSVVAIEIFNGGLVDIRNADIGGEVEPNALSSFRLDGDVSMVGNILNRFGSVVRIRNRSFFGDREVNYTGTLTCTDTSQTYFSNVQCGQTCNGVISGGPSPTTCGF